MRGIFGETLGGMVIDAKQGTQLHGRSNLWVDAFGRVSLMIVKNTTLSKHRDKSSARVSFKAWQLALGRYDSTIIKGGRFVAE